MELKGLSKKKVKKRLRNPNKNHDDNKRIKFSICEQCTNTKVRFTLTYFILSFIVSVMLE